MSILADLGFSGSIIALVGSQIHNKERVGNYLAAARYYRRRFLIISFVIGCFSIPFLTQRQDWNWQTQLALLVPIILTIYLQGAVSYYAAPVQMHRQLNAFYGAQIVQALVRLLGCSLLHKMGLLDVYSTLWLYNAALLWTGLAYRRIASPFQITPKTVDKGVRTDMITYLKPLIPSIVFNAFYGQITIFLITYYGQQSSMAELGALTRLGQLFMLLTTFNSVVIAPYIARLTVMQLPKTYCIILAGALLIAGIINGVVWSYPEGFYGYWAVSTHNLTANSIVCVQPEPFICRLCSLEHTCRPQVDIWIQFLALYRWPNPYSVLHSENVQLIDGV
jgi:O-antigen/teichoic acid export membrane protein